MPALAGRACLAIRGGASVVGGPVRAGHGPPDEQDRASLLLGHEIKGATATYGLFALVLGTLAWIYVGAVTTVLCAEFNTVLAGQLWPRSLLTPFTDNVDLTPADRRAYTSYEDRTA